MSVLIPVLTVAGVFGAWAVGWIANDRTERERRACGWLPMPWTQHAAAWGGVTLGIAAVFMSVVAARRVRARCGFTLVQVPVGVVAVVGAWLNVAAVPYELVMLYGTYVSNGSGFPHCM
ncbi:hypothetical protein [Embleya sp. AB8]|uniref:hypothetical protein n=1 Tax=Embleya sp. AB8 TaxID=3156304 RepID=UPI003C749410